MRNKKEKFRKAFSFILSRAFVRDTLRELAIAEHSVAHASKAFGFYVITSELKMQTVFLGVESAARRGVDSWCRSDSQEIWDGVDFSVCFRRRCGFSSRCSPLTLHASSLSARLVW